jgi:uncharacterized protein YicC (UPF0701 family)
MSLHTVFSADHGDIHDRLARASRAEGAIGEAARRVARYFAQHAEKEERLVTPLVALLPLAARGVLDARMSEALPLFNEFSDAVKDMISEHHMIGAALELLVAAARAEEGAELASLASRMVAHMRLEEEVVYPAALVLGKYLQLRLARA